MICQIAKLKTYCTDINYHVVIIHVAVSRAFSGLNNIGPGLISSSTLFFISSFGMFFFLSLQFSELFSSLDIFGLTCPIDKQQRNERQTFCYLHSIVNNTIYNYCPAIVFLQCICHFVIQIIDSCRAFIQVF